MKMLDELGKVLASLLASILTVLIISYVITLSTEKLTNKEGITSTLYKVDIPAMLKKDEQSWNEIVDFFKTNGIKEDQMESILNSNTFKEELSTYLDKIKNGFLSKDTLNITVDDLNNSISKTIDEYNKVNDNKISDKSKKKILKNIKKENLEDINSSINKNNIKNLSSSNSNYKVLADMLTKNTSAHILKLIIISVVLIIVFRFSLYKWMPYISSSLLASSITLFLIGISLANIHVLDVTISSFLLSIKDVFTPIIFKYASILITISISLFVINKVIKNNINKEQEYEEVEDNI